MRDGTASSLDDRIYLHAKVNGVDGRFILDTGASGIAFTDSFRRRIHSKKRSSVVLSGTAKSDVLLDSGNSAFALLSTDYLSRVRLATQTADFAGELSIIAIGPISYKSVFTCFSRSVDQRQGIVGLGKIAFVPRK